MRKLILTLLASIFLLSVSNAQVIFDPATYDASGLPAGMTIVDIGGTKYLKVTLNGWGNILRVLTTVLDDASTKVSAEMKYGVGTGGFTIDQINSVVQIMDTVNKEDDQWNPGNLVPSSTALVQSPASNDFTIVAADLNPVMKEVHQIQLFGQETTNWEPTYGDTVYIGKIEAVSRLELLTNVGFDNIEGPLITRTKNEWGMWSSNGGTAEVINGICTVHPVLDEVYNWSMQVEQWNFTLENNKTYTASFEAWSDADRVISLTIEDPGNNYTMLGSTESPGSYDLRSKWDINITTVPTVHHLIVTVDSMKSNSETKFAFLLAQSADVVYLDNVSLKEGITDGAEVMARNKAFAVFTPITPLIDGYEESQYKASSYNGFFNLAQGNVLNESDNSGYFHTLWDYSYLYCFARITDDDPIAIISGDTQPWFNDGIELFVDSKNRHLTGSSIDGEQNQFRINLGAVSPATGFNIPDWMENNDTTNIHFATLDYGSYYTIEAAIPWTTIFRTSYNTNLDAVNLASNSVYPGYNLGFEAQLLDANAVDQRKSILCWANNSGFDNDYLTSQYWGQLTLTRPEGILSDLTMNGSTVNGFHSDRFNYLYILPVGTTSIPEIGYELFEPGSTATIQNSVNLFGKTRLERSANITVTSSGGSISNTYWIEFYLISNDAVLSGIKVNKVDLPGFNPDVTSYQIELSAVQIPEINCQTAVESATIGIENATNLTGTEQERTVTIIVTSADGKSSKTYAILFSVKGLDVQSINKYEVKVFPSPAENWLTIQNLNRAQKIQVFGLSGKLEMETGATIGQEQKLDVSKLSSGVHILRVISADKTENLKFVKH